MTLAASARFLGYPPAVDFGFASPIATMQATGYGVFDAELAYPNPVAGTPILARTSSGIIPEPLAKI
jgi:hypothetical protein